MQFITIEVAFAPTATTQLLQKLSVAQGTTVQQAVAQLGWLERYPQISEYAVGIFAHKVAWDTVLTAGDRVEIYRPLTIDPIQKRQNLSKKDKRWRLN
ncbi:MULTISPECIES: RnfH family protein [unclassified Moraxella]|uniref:RnfH family protein n=1 Tax=unclassified Moraxella TaxID=2685852 RepID=UPI003AF9306A